jgi:signal transduction histidine kinase
VSARRLKAELTAPPMILICFEDITRRKRADEDRERLVAELEEARQRLELRVSERTEQLADSLFKLRDLSEKLVLAHESEQRRIARELHDQIGQDLTALRLMFHRAAADETNPARQTFADAVRVTDEAIQNVRTICSTLRPQALDDLGLVAGLKWHFQNFGARSNLKVEFEMGAFEEARLNDILQCTIFRVIQEALTNVARHAKAQRAFVSLEMTERDVLIQIRDHGKGFDCNKVAKNHHGVSSMRERVSLVSGQFEIKTRPGRGVTIDVKIPIPILSPENQKALNLTSS